MMTPLKWATWVIKKNDVFEQWMNGATVFDPTAGEGNFLEAMIVVALENGVQVDKGLLQRLFAIEREERFVARFLARMRERYHFDFPERNFKVQDFILSENSIRADVVVGNPPWQNFNDLPWLYKERLKPQFSKYDLIPDRQALLLGGSRIDIAALIIAKSLIENLKKGGSAYFFIPLSILLNDSAHRAFRSYQLGGVHFAVKEVYDFNNKDIFNGIATRYGLAKFRRDDRQSFPIPYFVRGKAGWSRKQARPIFRMDDPLSITADTVDPVRAAKTFQKIEVPLASKPRQGANTCGANHVFVFDSLMQSDGETAVVRNRINREVVLPLKYLFPLAAKENFNQDEPVGRRFVLLPYHTATGKPLEASEIEAEPGLYNYLRSQKPALLNRKGVLINSWIARGYWWALLGVGKYSFAPYKIMWEAYGSKRFVPKIFSSGSERVWQGNQSLHAYIPLDNYVRARRIEKGLRHPFVQEYLSSQRMEGTCNWAQPGRIGKLLEFVEECS